MLEAHNSRIPLTPLPLSSMRELGNFAVRKFRRGGNFAVRIFHRGGHFAGRKISRKEICGLYWFQTNIHVKCCYNNRLYTKYFLRCFHRLLNLNTSADLISQSRIYLIRDTGPHFVFLDEDMQFSSYDLMASFVGDILILIRCDMKVTNGGFSTWFWSAWHFRASHLSAFWCNIFFEGMEDILLPDNVFWF